MKIVRLIPVFFIFITLGCVEDNKPNCKVNGVKGDPKNVIGTWQLVSRQLFDMRTGEETFTDYSCDAVLFTFLDNGEFIVEGSSPEMPSFSTNTYEFQYGEKLGEFGNSTLRLSHLNHPCLIEKNKMTLDSTGLDGGILVFYRVR